MSLFVWPLIKWAGRNNQTATESASDGRDRVLWIVVVSLCSLACRRRRIQETIAFDAIRSARRMKEVLGVTSSRQRELVLIAPRIVPHHKEAHRRTGRILILNAFQDVIEPGPCSFGLIEHRVFSKYYVSDFPLGRSRRMPPRSHYQTLAFACGLRCRSFTHAHIIRESSLEKEIVPAAYMEAF